MMLLSLLLAVAQAPPVITPVRPPSLTLGRGAMDPLAGLSATGRAIVQAEMPIENQRQRERQARYAGAMASLRSALGARPISLAAVRQALADRDRILDENRRAQSAAAVALMQRLSEEDRRIVGQAIIRSPGSN